MSMYTIADMMQMLGVSRATIYARLREGAIPPPLDMPGRGVRWSREDVDQWLRALPRRTDAGGAP